MHSLSRFVTVQLFCTQHVQEKFTILSSKSHQQFSCSGVYVISAARNAVGGWEGVQVGALLIGCLAYLHRASFYQLYNKLFRPIYVQGMGCERSFEIRHYFAAIILAYLTSILLTR
jgi:hypothetical protein